MTKNKVKLKGQLTHPESHKLLFFNFLVMKPNQFAANGEYIHNLCLHKSILMHVCVYCKLLCILDTHDITSLIYTHSCNMLLIVIKVWSVLFSYLVKIKYMTRSNDYQTTTLMDPHTTLTDIYWYYTSDQFVTANR